MLTFAQFLTEYTEDDFKKREVGFLRPGKKAFVLKNHAGAAPTHTALARQHGFKDHHDAINHDLIRYHQRHDDGGSAGYEYKDNPTNRKAVSDHLGKSHRGFTEISLDTHHPSGETKSHWFTNIEAARKHLDSQK